MMYSTWYYNNEDILPLSAKVLIQDVRTATELTIVSAYYSVVFLEDIFNKIYKNKRANCVIRCIFNGFGGERLQAQLIELKEFRKKLYESGFNDVIFFLNREHQLFHTKLYFINGNNGVSCFIGSANASNRLLKYPAQTSGATRRRSDFSLSLFAL